MSSCFRRREHRKIEPLRLRGWPGVTPAAILTELNGWRAVAILADSGRASLVEGIPLALTTKKRGCARNTAAASSTLKKKRRTGGNGLLRIVCNKQG